MDEDPNWKPVFAIRTSRCCDVEEETIFTEGWRRRKLIDLLRTRAARCGRIEDRGRARRRSGGRPTIRTSRRVGVADALKLVDDTVAHPADRPTRVASGSFCLGPLKSLLSVDLPSSFPPRFKASIE